MTPGAQPELDPPTVVQTDAELRQVLEVLLGCDAVGVDTESNSLHAYYERICLIQFSTREADYIVDPLAHIDLAPLQALFGNPNIEKIFHAAEQDVAGMARDFGFEFDGLFDTMWGARVLGWPRVGLADLLEEHFGVHTNKRYQRYNWGKRPIEPQALDYARLDTHYLLPLRDLEREDMERMGRLAEAMEVFSQIAETPPATQPFGPDAFWRLKGVHKLSKRERAIVWNLYVWRDREASRRNRPPFKVVGNRTLLRLARARPRKLGQLNPIRGMSEYLVRRYGRAILNAVEKGRRGPVPKPPPHPPRPKRAVSQRNRKLRDWRRTVAERRGVDTDVVLPNAVVWAIAERNPSQLADLEEIEGLGPWKRQTYGREILRALGRSTE
ncbi:MAG: HRDC domain-containing protein [Anaerolineae bacterium]|jgi:ribonuclease D